MVELLVLPLGVVRRGRQRAQVRDGVGRTEVTDLPVDVVGPVPQLIALNE